MLEIKRTTQGAQNYLHILPFMGPGRRLMYSILDTWHISVFSSEWTYERSKVPFTLDEATAWLREDPALFRRAPPPEPMPVEEVVGE